MQLLSLIAKVLLIAGLASVQAAPAPRPGGGSSNTYQPPSGPGITEVSEARANELRSLAQIAQLSYCANPALLALTCIICSGPVKSFSNLIPIASPDSNTRGFMTLDASKKTIYLSFQGSANTQNWVSNLDAARMALNITTLDTRSPYAQAARDSGVHSGFQKAYERVKAQVRSNLSALLQRQPDATFQAVGHSYGCSMSTLAVVDLIMSKQIPASRVSLTGFGCPRVGNYEFARLVDTQLGLSSVTRVVHSADLVVRLPPTPLGFRHAGKEVWIDVDAKKMFECTNVRSGLDESPSCSNNVPELSLNTRSHSSYFINTSQENVCSTVPAGSLVTFPVKYLPFEVNSSG
ncbi:hypothetical protein HDU67_009473 [Dinochytrium kinnereticum]|nr:hypothetical protein HDU67_009473 [Dinochytrium kinnereticum]